MTKPSRTVHLIDDRRVGGVMRFLEQLADLRPHDRTVFVKRGTMRGHSHEAETIVSHLAISWRTLPMLITLRACNPQARLIHVEHSYCRGFEKHRVDPRKSKRFYTLLRSVYALFDEVIAVSKGQAQWISDLGIIPNRKIEIATPLVDLSPFFDTPAPETWKSIRYGYLGRLDEQKGIDLVLPVFRKYAPQAARFEIYGDGPMREALENLAAGDERITFHGRTNRPAEAYNSFDVALMPSRWEPYGLSCLEAQAAGRPVLVSNVDGLPEQVANGGGRIIAANDEAWATVFSTGMTSQEIAAASIEARHIAHVHAAQAEAHWIALLNESTLSPPHKKLSQATT